jgi:hypothetical protein
MTQSSLTIELRCGGRENLHRTHFGQNENASRSFHSSAWSLSDDEVEIANQISIEIGPALRHLQRGLCIAIFESRFLQTLVPTVWNDKLIVDHH